MYIYIWIFSSLEVSLCHGLLPSLFTLGLHSFQIGKTMWVFNLETLHLCPSPGRTCVAGPKSRIAGLRCLRFVTPVVYNCLQVWVKKKNSMERKESIYSQVLYVLIQMGSSSTLPFFISHLPIPQGRVSRPEHSCRFSAYNSLSWEPGLGGAGCLVASLLFPTRCQEHLPSSDNQKCFQTLANVP